MFCGALWIARFCEWYDDAKLNVLFVIQSGLMMDLACYFRAHVDHADLLDLKVYPVAVECLDRLVPVVTLVVKESVDLLVSLENLVDLDCLDLMDALDLVEIR